MNFSEIYKKLSFLGISKMFNNYNKGTRLINKSVNKRRLVFENKKLMKYGKKILNLTHQEILKFI